MGRSLSNISDIATERTNTTGVLSPILEIQPRDGTQLIIKNMVESGSEMGVPIFAELKDAVGDDLPADTRLALQFERPTDDSPQTVSDPKENIRPYRSLSIRDQQDTEFIDRVKHVLKGDALVVDDVDKLFVSVDSSEQVDFDNTRITFDENAVEEV